MQAKEPSRKVGEGRGDRAFMEVHEFVAVGYLQEVNRRFLHPLGLALEVEVTDDGMRLSGVWDCRDDPEGIYFEGASPTRGPKAARIDELLSERADARLAKLGFLIQPV
jgi:hypothetical protein